MRSEAAVARRLAKSVRTLGGRCVTLAPTTLGVPDRLVLLPGGRIYLVELKDHGGRLSAHQELWHQSAERLGSPVIVLVGAEGVDRWIAEVGGPPRRAATRPPAGVKRPPVSRPDGPSRKG